jgi:hypothetical protein
MMFCIVWRTVERFRDEEWMVKDEMITGNQLRTAVEYQHGPEGSTSGYDIIYWWQIDC